MAARKDKTSLKQELEIAAIYQRIENCALATDSTYAGTSSELPMRALIPSFTVQPLLENAIIPRHRTPARRRRSALSAARAKTTSLTLRISNPGRAECRRREKTGNKMAMSNIRQRFEFAYGNRATVEVEESDDAFSVFLRFPIEEASA